MTQTLRTGGFLLLVCLGIGFGAPEVRAAPEDLGLPFYDGEDGLRHAETPEETATVIEIVFLLTVLTLAPSLLVLTTAFTRIVVVLAFLRRALATQQLPPDQVMMGLSLFLTFAVMAPTWKGVYEEAIVPYLAEENAIDRSEAFRRAKLPIKRFMVRQMRLGGEDYAELSLFLGITRTPVPEGGYARPEEVPLLPLIPAFVLSELKVAFQMGFLLYLPFLIVDMVVASVLMSMGMLMLPPIIISLPFKILLFVIGDGWTLVVEGLVLSFGGA